MVALVLPHVASWHMGALHPFEQALTLLLAFGPFVVLGFVLWRRRKEDAAVADDQESERTDLSG
ncbi:hypothetical protein GCM10011376_24520 [Nocardioides flavus (ex Wang et al. 2016)]|uniref:Uncharacterized protein n=1 Tax=Nocardioides flavus (ex Wang et al. 2016) TaxID=2058780 RepID=A0ABQ3HMH5_9ACTN|nr:hypothetical protein [Nocardioides flavus (ex Wang et al. 2016)]GHE17842.1 hypothetical protein GCM10011376_24520 [Nocardioides flavus (ex Wang et al. 2016)]